MSCSPCGSPPVIIESCSPTGTFMGCLSMWDCNYKQSDSTAGYPLGAFALYGGKAIRSKVANNKKHPDDAGSWEMMGDICDLINKMLAPPVTIKYSVCDGGAGVLA